MVAMLKPETRKTSKSFREVIEEIIRSWKHLKSFNISWIFQMMVISLISRTYQSVLKVTKVDFGSGRRTSGCWGLKVDITIWSILGSFFCAIKMQVSAKSANRWNYMDIWYGIWWYMIIRPEQVDLRGKRGKPVGREVEKPQRMR